MWKVWSQKDYFTIRCKMLGEVFSALGRSIPGSKVVKLMLGILFKAIERSIA